MTNMEDDFDDESDEVLSSSDGVNCPDCGVNAEEMELCSNGKCEDHCAEFCKIEGVDHDNEE